MKNLLIDVEHVMFFLMFFPCFPSCFPCVMFFFPMFLVLAFLQKISSPVTLASFFRQIRECMGSTHFLQKLLNYWTGQVRPLEQIMIVYRVKLSG